MLYKKVVDIFKVAFVIKKKVFFMDWFYYNLIILIT